MATLKIRKGFIANSSSSSFVCDLCGIVEIIWDGEGQYGDPVECKSHHTFHRECAEKELGIKIDMDKVYEEDDNGLVPPEQCPICQGKVEINKTNEINKKVLEEYFNSCG